MRLLSLILAALALTTPAFAKHKEAPIVYDLTGSIGWDSPKYDPNAIHVNGDSCYVSRTSADCFNLQGERFITLADGTKTNDDALTVVSDGTRVNHPLPAKPGAQFQYRLIHIDVNVNDPMRGPIVVRKDFFCVPYVDYRGKATEACGDITKPYIAPLPDFSKKN